MKRKREETEPVTKTTKQSEKREKRNEKRRIGRLAHSIARGEVLESPELLALIGDISEYDEKHQMEEFIWSGVTDENESIVMYPENIKKYNGSALRRGKSWQTEITIDGVTKTRTFGTQEEAVAHVKKTSIDAGIVKNVVYRNGEDYYVALTNRQLMTVSKESLSLVESHTIFAHYDADIKSYYASTSIDGKPVKFHTLLCKANVGETVDHINGVTLDNTLPNLRSAGSALQGTNQNRKPTATGVTGVRERKTKGITMGYIANWREDGTPRYEEFSIAVYGENALNLAKKVRAEKVRTLPMYKVAFRK